MKIKGNSIERVVPIAGFLFLLIAAVSSFFMEHDSQSFLEKFVDSQIVVSTVHIFCAIACAVLIIRPSTSGMIVILMTESVLTTLTNYTQLGIFMFYVCIFIISLKDMYSQHRKLIVLILTLIHVMSLALSYTHGIPRLCVNVFSSAFYLVIFTWFYAILREKFSCFLPKNVSENQTLGNKRQGEEVKLSDYKLSERQSQFILENLYNNLSFKELSEKYYVSLSTVKSEFAVVYRLFGVKKLEELRILLLQYQVVK